MTEAVLRWSKGATATPLFTLLFTLTLPALMTLDGSRSERGSLKGSRMAELDARFLSCST